MSDQSHLIAALQPLLDRVRTDATCIKLEGRQAWTREALTPARLAKHLNGGPARGVCPIKAGENTTRVAVLDLDSHKGETSWDAMTEHTAAICAVLESRHLSPIVWRSSGGKGIHIFMLWDKPQDAYSVRAYLTLALSACGFRNGPAGVGRSEIEVFPKQNEVLADKFGNQVILPLAGLSVPLEPLAGYAPLEREAALTLDWPMSHAVPIVQRPERVAPSLEVSVALHELQAALKAIPNEGSDELDYDAWRNTVFAIHHETGGSDEGLALAHAFSARSSKYDPDFLDNRVWPYITDREGGITGRSILALAREHGYQEDITAEFDAIDAIDAPEAHHAPALPSFIRDKQGAILPTVDNVTKGIARPDICGFHLGYDAFRDEIMLDEKGDGAWRSFTDADYVRIRIELERRGFKSVPKELARDVVLLVSEDHRFDSAQLWLNSLEWDGVKRIATCMPKYFGAESSAYTRAVGLYMWSAMAGRVLDPGCKADMAPILVGAQGAGKSTAVAALSPAPEFFAEINLSEDDDNLSRKMRGRLVAELAELKGLHNKELESVKAFVSRTHEDWTPKYREYNTVFPRRLILIGTTNKDEFLADETGNRRWLPIEVGAMDVASLRRDCLQLWAEARELFKTSGVQFRDAERMAGDVHGKHMISDVWESEVEFWLDEEDIGGITPRSCEFLRTEDVLKFALKFDVKAIKRADEMRVGAILCKLGYTRKLKRVNKRPLKVWVRSVTT